MLIVRTKRDIALYAVAMTAIAVAATAGFVHVATSWTLSSRGYALAMLLAVGLPMVIAVPVATIAFRMVRMMTEALDTIEAFAQRDVLTGTLTRSYFMEQARQAFPGGGALLLIDADHFKQINDIHGHDIGDEALRMLGATLRFSASDRALVGRIGGEEFAVFVPGADENAAEATAVAINAAMRASGAMIADRPVGMTVSIGVTMVMPGAALTLPFKQADDCLFAAKQNGRDRYVFAGPPMLLIAAA